MEVRGMKLRNSGALQLLRKNTWLTQYCKYGGKKTCNDKCPMMSEPKLARGVVTITICERRSWSCNVDDFEDIRNSSRKR